MSRDLKALRKRLRAERCPAAVLDRVHHEIFRRRRRRSLVCLASVAAVFLFLGILSLSLVRLSFKQSPAPVAAATLEDKRAVREQAGLALALMGQTLIRAGDQSRDIILEVSLPPLRQGLRTAREVISNPETKPSKTTENQ